MFRFSFPHLFIPMQVFDMGIMCMLTDSFTWLRRIKVAVGLACVIDFFHNAKHGSIGYLLRNIGPRHVILDEDFSPRIIDFGMVSGGVLADKRNIETEKVDGCYGYFDPGFALPGRWSKECDIFSYGAVLIGLLTNKVYDEEGYLFQNASFCDLFVWAEDALLKNKVTNAIGRTKCLLVHENLRTDEGFRRSDGYQITELMMRCISSCHFFRPSMNEVVKCLLRLHVVQKNADFIGAKDKVNSYMMLEMLRDYIKGSNLFRDQYNRTWRYKAKKMLLHSRTA